MKRMMLLVFVVLLRVSVTSTRPAPQDVALQTRPERTNFEETSRLEDVLKFLAALPARAELIRIQTFGTSELGRPLILVTLSNPPVARPRDLRALDRPVVFVQANIHGGLPHDHALFQCAGCCQAG